MSKKISRRSFLKCAGAVALAAGAASVLGGCSPVDDAINGLFEQIGAQRGHAAATMGKNVWVGLSNKAGSWHNSENEVSLATIEFQVKNKRSEALTFRASDITNVKIDGHKAHVVIAPDPERFNSLDQYPALFDRETGTKTYQGNPGMDESENGYIFFAPDYEENEEHSMDRWKNIEFTFAMNGSTATFTATWDENNHVTSAKK